MTYTAYPAYKESGVEWLGQIPEAWEISTIGKTYSVQLGKMLQNDPQSPSDTFELYLRASNIKWEGVDYSDIKRMWFSSQEKKKYCLKNGDLLISEGGDAGRSCIFKEISEDSIYIQNAINCVSSPNENSTSFLYYWVFMLKSIGYIDMICNKATIMHYTAEKVKSTLLALPSLSEQRAIAAFLDGETARIDTLIAKQQRMIELLKERRSALITAAVTGKIDVRAAGAAREEEEAIHAG